MLLRPIVTTLALALLLVFAASASLAQKAAEGEAQPKDNLKERRAEGEQLLGSARDRIRVAYAKTGALPTTLTAATDKSGTGMEAKELTGTHFKLQDKVFDAGTTKAAVVVEPIKEGDGFGINVFELATGKSTYGWHSTMDALKKANKEVTFGEAEKDKTEATGEKNDAAADPYALYKKKGRTWTHKSSIKIAGMDDMVNHMKYEVTEVADDHAMYKVWMLDKDKKAMAGMPEPTPTRIDFAKPNDAPASPDAPKVETKDETVEVAAGKFECIAYDFSGTKSWMSKKYPGLLVKMESETMTMELIEFKD